MHGAELTEENGGFKFESAPPNPFLAQTIIYIYIYTYVSLSLYVYIYIYIYDIHM